MPVLMISQIHQKAQNLDISNFCRACTSFHMLHSTPLSFGSFQTPMLYNGCRSGEIFSIDVRQRNRKGQNWKAIRLFHDSAVTSIRLLEAEHYLMASDMAGKVWLYYL